MVSIVVPVYNMEKFLPRCMDTLVSQSSDYEIILVDDGSTDRSPELCDDYRQRYPSLVRVIHKRNSGLSSARNAGIEAAKGTYVIFPDPDDWVEPNYVSKMVEFQNYYQPDLLCVGYYVDTDGKCVPANEGQKTHYMDRAAAQQALFIPPKMGGFAWNKLYHLDMIREHNLHFLDDAGITEDLDFAFRYLLYCDTVCFVPGTRLYHYYQRSGAATHSEFSRKKIETIRIDQKYKLYVMNEVVCEVEYQADGSTGTMWKQYLKNPKGFAFLRKAAMQYPSSKKRMIQDCIHYCSSSQIAKNRKYIQESPRKLLTVLCTPLGWALTEIVRNKAKENG